MKKYILMFAFAFITSNSYAAGSSFTGTIKNVVCHANNISPVCNVQVNGEPAGRGCSTADWHYAFDGTNAEGKNFLSILLAAQISRQTVVIAGQGTCDLAGGSDDLRHIYITTPN